MSKDVVLAMCSGVSLGFAAGLVVLSQIADSYWEAQAIEHNAAHYDPKTGAFTWNEPGE